MAVSKISENTRDKIIKKSVNPLPNSPSRVGYSASDIKGAMFKFVTDEENSVISEINRVVDEVNTEIVSRTNTYVHEQAIASATWEINHNLGRYPSVTVVDSAGDKVETLTHYVDENNVRLEFTAEFGGKAYLN